MVVDNQAANNSALVGNSDLLRQLNSGLVYRLIDQHGAISRIQIAEQSQLAPASVSKITRQLLQRGLIAEQEQQASTGGRRAISLVTVRAPFQTIALRLGRSDATFALYDLAGNTLAEQCYPFLTTSPPTLSHNSALSHSATPADNLQPSLTSSLTQQALQQALLQALDDFRSRCKPLIHELIAIAIVAPGLVSEQNGVIDYLPQNNVHRWSLAYIVQQHTGVNCFIGHDIRSLTLAEHYFGCLRHCQDGVLIRVHQGTGAGILSAGAIFTARNGNVGEIGHIQVDPLGERCHCGNFGCLETLVANNAIEQRVRLLLHQGHSSMLRLEHCTIQAICQAASQGDALATEVLCQVSRHIGRVLAMVVNLFHPQKIVLAGEITAAQQIIVPVLHDCLHQQALPAFCQQLSIQCTSLPHQSAIGAFALVKRAMLDGVLLQKLLDK